MVDLRDIEVQVLLDFLLENQPQDSRNLTQTRVFTNRYTLKHGCVMFSNPRYLCFQNY